MCRHGKQILSVIFYITQQTFQMEQYKYQEKVRNTLTNLTIKTTKRRYLPGCGIFKVNF